jgi:Holliday junction resolvasome RuvABC DNA-binding subunit
MAKKTGLFARANNLVGTTLEEAESTIGSTLKTVSSTMAIMPTVAEEFHNDSKESLIGSRVSLAVAKSGANETLKNLGYSAEEIEEILAV